MIRADNSHEAACIYKDVVEEQDPDLISPGRTCSVVQLCEPDGDKGLIVEFIQTPRDYELTSLPVHQSS